MTFVCADELTFASDKGAFRLTVRKRLGAITSMPKRIFLALALLIGCSFLVTSCKSPARPGFDTRCYEMRIYYAPPGKLDELHARFRNHTMKLFAKHGIENIGYWVPAENGDNKLIYLLAYSSRAARDIAWREFLADPEWKAVQQRTEANGRIVAKVEQTFLQTTDYSPKVKLGNFSDGGVFELRTYTTPPGLLPNLDARFREHTMKLFAKHGMKNWAYFHKTSDQPNADTTLIYLLAHNSAEAAKSSFDAFRRDPDWIAAREASEKKAGGSLTVKDGVKSVILIPTDYSPTK